MTYKLNVLMTSHLRLDESAYWSVGKSGHLADLERPLRWYMKSPICFGGIELAIRRPRIL